MSPGKALPNRLLRQSQENRPPYLLQPGELLSESLRQKIRLVQNNSGQPGVAIPNRANADSNRDNPWR